MISSGTNALASSIVLVCRMRSAGASSIGRREFLHELRSVMTDALVEMTRGGENSPVAPVGLSQAIIGAGMAVFSKYTSVLEVDGSAMPVRTALRLINSYMAQDDIDSASLFCMDWYRENGWNLGLFG
jgi:putative DNA methylase